MLPMGYSWVPSKNVNPFGRSVLSWHIGNMYVNVLFYYIYIKLKKRETTTHIGLKGTVSDPSMQRFKMADLQRYPLKRRSLIWVF